MAKITTSINNNVNTNNNVNNNNVHVNVHVPNSGKQKSKKQTKPNWILKAVVIGIIGLLLSLIGYYVKNHKTEKQGPAIINNHSNQIIRNR